MAHLVISIPGRTTHLGPSPKWSFTGGGSTSARVTIRYQSDLAASSWGEITFSGVLECRWIKAGLEYDEHVVHADDRSDGLIEIVESAYIAAMDAMGWHKRSGRLQDYPKPVRHFRFCHASWGELNVIATGIVIRTIDADDGVG